MFTCKFCNYTTKRKYNLSLHLRRKNPCSLSAQNEPFLSDNEASQSLYITCKHCNAMFSNKSNLARHAKYCTSKKVLLPHLLEQVNKLRNDLEETKVNHNTISVIDNSTIHNTIIYNNYNTPDVSHITPDLIANLYTHFNRDIKLLVNDVVHRIYKGKPENDCIKFIEGTKSSFVEVQHMDQKRLLPVQEVCETILTNICVLCEKHIQDCLFDGLVIGDSCSYAAQEFEQLGIDARIEHKEHRAAFLPYVKSALL